MVELLLSTPEVPVASPSATDDARYQRALNEIYGRLNFERTPDAAKTLEDFHLHQMSELLAELGNPQVSIPTVHIAGSKGKGSTATMVARIAEAAGYRVGLYTSPHVERFEERFTVGGLPPTPRQVADLYDRLKVAVESLQKRSPQFSATFFELATAMGWLLFSTEKVDLAVMEVGLGGRLDCTNICNPWVTLITSISRDHTRLLGNTLPLIAREKAGIIKPGIPVITNVEDPDAALVTEEIAHEHNAPQYRLGLEIRHTPHSGQALTPFEPACFSFDYQGLGVDLNDVSLGMPGEHQTRNAALAVSAAILLRDRGFQLTDDSIRDGLKNAVCPLRVEITGRAPLTIVDAAHNPASIAALCETLKSVSARRRIAIFASSKDKEANELLSILNQSMDEIWVTRFSNNPRSIDLEEIEKIAHSVVTKPWRVFNTLKHALEESRRVVQPDDLLCITGSFFLAAEAKSLLADGNLSVSPEACGQA